MIARKHHILALATLLSSTALTSVAAEYPMCEAGEECPNEAERGKLGTPAYVKVAEYDELPRNLEFRDTADEAFVVRPAIEDLLEEDKAGEVWPFSSGKHFITEGEKASLSKIATKHEAQKIGRIEIVGYADIQRLSENAKEVYGTNQKLSEERAKAAAEFVNGLAGLEGISIATLGRGDGTPRTKCASLPIGASEAQIADYQQCLAEDRRIEVKIWYVPEQTAQNACSLTQGESQNLPFRISVDGQPIDGLDTANSADVERCNDVELEKADIQVRFEGFEIDPVLNITPYPAVALRGGEVSFLPYSNYHSFIEKAEIRIFPADGSIQKEPLEIVDLGNKLDSESTWQAFAKSDLDAVKYVLRVYDEDGDFDETAPKELSLVDELRPYGDEDSEEDELLAGYDENHLAIQNISIFGGAVTVNGTKLQAGTEVNVMGKTVPVDANGTFAYRQIISDGDHDISVLTSAPDGTKAEFNRSLYIPSDDWFYVALGDLTLGKNDVSGPAPIVTGQDTDRNRGKVYAEGRAAFYLKGKVKGEWLLTASADTQERPLEDLFSGFADKDPRNLLRRIDPNAYYPIYGDDSTTVEDAPTQGKFYVRLEKGDSKILWGNFKTSINGTDLVNYNRGLYGAQLEYNSEDVTSYGEKRTEIDGFAADPGTIASLEEFRGTGGSLYYFQGQDLVIGSERLRVETRDRDSNIVLDSRYLVYGRDYEVNYIQGRVILREPLSSTSSQSTVVRTGSLSGNPEFLVASYEYTPGVASVENLVIGGHASHWVNDNLKIGITSYEQNNPGIKQDLKGLDATIRYAPGTYLKLEAARSEGPGDGALFSQNGGFNFDSIPQTTGDDIEANAYRAETGIDFSEFTEDYKGTANAYVVKREDGFSAPGQLTNEEITQAGFSANLPISADLNVDLKGDLTEGQTTGDRISGEIAANYKASDEDTITVAIRSEDRDSALSGGNSPTLSRVGSRTDAALKYTYSPLNEAGEKDNYEVYALGQATVQSSGNREDNNRAGVGGSYDWNDRVTLNGEVTGGDGGLGALAGVDYKKSDRTTYYANYLADNERTDLGYRGKSKSITAGAKSRYTDSLSVFSEHRFQSLDNGPSGLIHGYGLDFAATDAWTFGGRVENGELNDPVGGDTDRTAVSVNTGYSHEKTKYSSTVEWRDDENSLNGQRTSWLMRNDLAYQTSEDWRLQTGLDFALSDSNGAGIPSSDYLEFDFGYAYRPVLNDRLNMLFRYSYLDEQASTGQLSPTQTVAASTFEQRSHVLAIDGIYDLTPKLSLGGKVGYRFGELRDVSAVNPVWFDSQAWLGVVRADYHIVHKWDILGELRYLEADEAEDSRAGALLGVYRHINENMKIGVGYNFTDFSDDLTDLDYRSDGVFVNFVGKL